MGIVIFFALALAVAAAIAYPLLPGRAPAQPSPAVTDHEIDHAVSELRQTRRQGDMACPACGRGYQPGDRFCVRCGKELPEVQTAAPERLCPQCGGTLHQGDQFCAKCGHSLAGEEAA